MGQVQIPCSPCESYNVREPEIAEDWPLKDRAGAASASRSFLQEDRKKNDWRGVYDANFINGITQAYWPMVESFMRQILKDSVVPAVKKALGSLSSNFSMDTDKFRLGKDAVKFGNFMTTKSVQHTTDPDDPEMDVLVVRSLFDWQTADISLFGSVAGVQVGITKMTMRGDLVLECVGNMPSPPFFQGVRLCFMKAPKIDLTFDFGSAMNVLTNLAPLKQIFQQVVQEQISEKLVVPNRMGFKLDRRADIFNILHPSPRGILKLTVTRAEALKAMDINLFGVPSSDPLIKVRCGASISASVQSEVVRGTTSPEWNHEISIPIHQPKEQHVTFHAEDHDQLSANDHLGELAVPVRTLIRQGPTEVAYELRGHDDSTGSHGRIFVKAEWRPLLLNLSKTPDAASKDPSYVFVGVRKAEGLSIGPAGSQYWVTVDCSNRQGLGGSDTSKPKNTTKKNQVIVEESKEAKEMAARLFREKKRLCEKYKMSTADMARLLGIEPRQLSEDYVDRRDQEISWNQCIQFFVHDAPQAHLDITLNCARPKADKDGALDVKQQDSGVVSKARKAMQSMGKSAARHLLSDTSGKHVIHRWRVPLSELNAASLAQQDRRLAVPGSHASLHVLLQVRSLGEPSTECESICS